MAGRILSSSFKKKITDLIVLGIGGTITFTGIGIYLKEEKLYSNILMPFLHKLDPERSHTLSILFLKLQIPTSKTVNFSSLKTKVLGINFENPIGIAAGYDKNGEAVQGLAKMGFGFIEVGSVTPKPQLGNSKPRLFRLPNSKGVINRFGFNSDGHDLVYERLQCLDLKGKRSYVLGVNLGKNKESTDPINDFVLGVTKFGSLADYLVINVSSPNTQGLRKLQQKNALQELTIAVLKARDSLPCNPKPPILFKLSPDLSYSEKKDIVTVITKKQCKVDGLIVSNTTISRPEDVSHDDDSSEGGGLSGQPLKALALQSLRDIAILTKGEVPLIGVGGVASGEDALEKIYNGACLVQLYSALAFSGPPLVHAVKKDLYSLLEKDGFSNLEDAVGAKLKEKVK